MENNDKIVSGVILLILAILFIVLSPLVCIWALNTLFPLAISYTFTTWFAMFVVITLFGKSIISLKMK